MEVRWKPIFRLFLITGSLCLNCASCEVDYRVRADFYYLNDSAFDIVLRCYTASTGRTMLLTQEISIASKAEHKLNIDTEGPENMPCEDFTPPVESDSLSISYSNGSISSFKRSDSTSDNPMLIGNYTSEEIAHNYCEFRFTIN